MPENAGAIVVMGVAGSGKTSVGEALAARLGVVFRDADEFHPRSNIEKMSSGIPLNDEDRWPWLDAIGAALREASASGRGIVVACSALKRIYRDRLRAAAQAPVLFIFLDGPRELLAERITKRRGHFMPPSLLDSQLATLERPRPEEGALTVSIVSPVEAIVSGILADLPKMRANLAVPPSGRVAV